MSKESFILSLLNSNGDILSSNNYENILKDDTIENVKFKLCNDLKDKNPSNYLFFYKKKFEFIHDYEVLFKKMSHGDEFITHRIMSGFSRILI